MPVEPSTVVADGYRRDEDAEEWIFAVTSLANVSIIKSAERITVAAADPRLSQESRTIKIDRVGQVPLTEAQIANVIGNPIAARKAFTDAGGAPYAVFFAPTGEGEELRGRASAAAVITVTTDSPAPLSLLFGG